MHEYGVIQSLLSQVDDKVRAHAGQRAVRVVLTVTGATPAEEGLLRHAFDQFKAGTTAGAAELVLEGTPRQVYCLDCEAVVTPAGGCGGQCPRCGSGSTLPADRHDILLKSVEIEV